MVALTRRTAALLHVATQSRLLPHHNRDGCREQFIAACYNANRLRDLAHAGETVGLANIGLVDWLRH
jgi:hypothetical protein